MNDKLTVYIDVRVISNSETADRYFKRVVVSKSADIISV